MFVLNGSSCTMIRLVPFQPIEKLTRGTINYEMWKGKKFNATVMKSSKIRRKPKAVWIVLGEWDFLIK